MVSPLLMHSISIPHTEEIKMYRYFYGACQCKRGLEDSSYVFMIALIISLYLHLSWKPSTISVRLDFLKCVHIFFFFKRQICKEIASRFTDEKIYTHVLYSFAFWGKWKSGHTWENLDGQKLLAVSVSVCIIQLKLFR